MKIAVCDNNKNELNIITEALKKYRTPSGESVLFDVYESGIDLLSGLDNGRYDALLLDILMPVFDGMETARDIRKKDENIPIIFLTSSPEFAVESYRVRAFDYLLKPVNHGELYQALDRIYSCTEAAKENVIAITTPRTVMVVPITHLEFLEISSKTLHFHLLDGSEKKVGGKLTDYETQLLAYPQFIKVHRSYIVNMNLMKALNTKSFVTLTGAEIPISRTLTKEIRNIYTNYLHSAMRNNS